MKLLTLAIVAMTLVLLSTTALAQPVEPGKGALERRDPGSGELIPGAARIDLPAPPTAIALVNSEIWVAHGEGTITRFYGGGAELDDPQNLGGTVVGFVTVPGSDPCWAALDNGTGGGTIARLDASGALHDSIDLAGAPTAIAYHANYVWVGLASGGLQRINPSGTLKDEAAVLDDVHPVAFALAGGVWVALEEDGVTVHDPETLTEIDHDDLNATPTSMFNFGESIWIGLDDGRVARYSAINASSSTIDAHPESSAAVTAMLGKPGGAGIWCGLADGWLSEVGESLPDPARIELEGSPVALLLANSQLWVAMGPAAAEPGVPVQILVSVEPATLEITASGLGATTSADLVLKNDGEIEVTVSETTFDPELEAIEMSTDPAVPFTIPSGDSRTLTINQSGILLSSDLTTELRLTVTAPNATPVELSATITLQRSASMKWIVGVLVAAAATIFVVGSIARKKTRRTLYGRQ